MNCICPLPAALANLPKRDCPENIGQIQKQILQRASANFSFADETAAGLLINWTPLLTAPDDTKIITTEEFVNHVIPQAEAITEGGGDNTTLNGVEEVLGSGPLTVTAQYRNPTNAYIKAKKQLICETSLTFAYINNSKKIWMKQPGGPGTPVFFIPMQSFFISDAGSEGLNTADKSNWRYSLVDGWREDLVAITPSNFDPHVDLGPF